MGKRILITGASRGIGRAIASMLSEVDNYLFLQGRDESALKQTLEIVNLRRADGEIILADLSQSSDVFALAGRFSDKPIDILINNAGMAVVKPIEDITLEEWHKTFAVNVTAPFLLTQQLFPKMDRGSAIVNISSIAAKNGFPGWSSYCMSKFALEGFTQSLREEARDRGIRVINIYPAATATDIWNDIQGDWPRKKMLSADEVADAVRYALSCPSDVLVDTISLGTIWGTL